MTPLSRLAAFGLLLISSCVSVNAKTFVIRKVFHIKSSGGWDYLAVSPVNNNLYVSHGTQVNILNKITGDSVGIIPHTLGVHGIAFAAPYNRGYISNGRLNNVYVFDMTTDLVIDSITTGKNPDAMCYDPFSRKLLVSNGRSEDLTVIDPSADKVVATIPLGGAPEEAVPDGTGNIFINLEDKNEIVVVDINKMKVTSHIPLGPGQAPAGLAIDTKRGILFSGCGNRKMVIVDAKNRKILQTLPIGGHCDGVVFDAGTGNVLTSNGEGTMTIIHTISGTVPKYRVEGNVPTRRGARTITRDAKTGMVYLPTADYEAGAAGSRERAKMIPGTFQVLVLGIE
jgi:YVTN family beta-propeller protein